jgi:hypothetical protein
MRIQAMLARVGGTLCMCVRTTVLWTPHQRYAVLALHGRRDGVAEELGFGPELADDADLVRGRNVEEGGYGWVVRYCRNGTRGTW